jgi:hypothetical protein
VIFPTSRDGWQALLLVWLGGLVGWALHPLVWLAFGPFRWLAFLSATAAVESRFDTNAVGDLDKSDASYGILQFNARPELQGKAFQSGQEAGRYVQDAILAHPSWLLALLIPVWGWVAFRQLWTRGASGIDDAWKPASANETEGIQAIIAWRALSLGLVTLLWRNRR